MGYPTHYEQVLHDHTENICNNIPASLICRIKIKMNPIYSIYLLLAKSKQDK